MSFCGHESNCRICGKPNEDGRSAFFPVKPGELGTEDRGDQVVAIALHADCAEGRGPLPEPKPPTISIGAEGIKAPGE